MSTSDVAADAKLSDERASRTTVKDARAAAAALWSVAGGDVEAFRTVLYALLGRMGAERAKRAAAVAPPPKRKQGDDPARPRPTSGAVRAWARDQGLPVCAHGSVPRSYVDAYIAAKGGEE